MKTRNIILTVVAVIAVIAAACCAYRLRYYFIGTSSAPVDAKENEDLVSLISTVRWTGMETALMIRRISCRAQEIILRRSLSIRVNITVRGIRTISMASARM